MTKKLKNSINNAQEARENLEIFLHNLLDEQELHIELELQVNTVQNRRIGFSIELNNILVFENFYSKGDHSVDLRVPYRDLDNQLRLSMFNKSMEYDTLVKDGIILEDTNIIIRKFQINNFDIINDPAFYYNKFYYTDNDTGQDTEVKQGFWTNSTLGINFTKPFIQWYQENTTKNISVAQSLEFMTTKQDEEFYNELVDKIEKI